MKDCKALWLGEKRQLFALQHQPSGAPADTGVLILNAGLLHNVGPFHLHVLLGRALAESGFVVTRLDQSGKGESARRKGVKRNDSILQDYDDALESMAPFGVRKLVIVGLCSGADDGSFIAAKRDSVVGLVSFDGYAHRNLKFYAGHYLRRVFSPSAVSRIARRLARLFDSSQSDGGDPAGLDIRDWASDDEMLARFATLVDRGGKVLSVFTSGQDYYNYHGQLADNLRGKVSLESVDEDYHPLVDHTFSTQLDRTELVARVTSWLQSNY